MQATPVQQDTSRRQKSRRPDRRQLTRAGVTAVLLLFVLFGLPQLMSLYYIDTMTQVAVYSMVAVGLGLLVGRVGLVSLGQVAVLAIGAWVAARLLFATTQPYPLVRAGRRGPLSVLDRLPQPRFDHAACGPAPAPCSSTMLT